MTISSITVDHIKLVIREQKYLQPNALWYAATTSYSVGQLCKYKGGSRPVRNQRLKLYSIQTRLGSQRTDAKHLRNEFIASNTADVQRFQRSSQLAVCKRVYHKGNEFCQLISPWTKMTSRNKGLNENDQICRKDGLSEKLTSSAHSPVCTQLFLWHMDEHECRRCPNKLRRQCKSLAITAAQCLRIVLLSGCCDVSDEFCNDTLATQWSDSDSD